MIIQHSAVAVVFAVSAIESALNTFVSRPLLDIQEPAVREFFATLLHKYFRGSLPQKLTFLRQTVPAIRKDLLKAVERLAAARNSLMHIYPDYVVALGPRLNGGLPLSEEDWVEYPDLQWTKQHVATPAVATSGYSTAVEFIDALPLTLPPYERMRIADNE
jgi:hypothetical protein